MSNRTALSIRSLDDLAASRPDTLDAATVSRAAAIVEAVRTEGIPALLRYATELDGWDPSRPWWYGPEAMQQALEELDPVTRTDLEMMRDQIHTFASAQRASLNNLDIAVPGGRAGHNVVPVARAGCYAPAGRFPLPSSLLMGVVTARAAGVEEIWAASPNPSSVMLAAAAIAGADGLIAVGGAQAIAALAFGVGPVPPCDVVVGPGNRWVTAGKYAVAGRVGIDFLAGPSELAILADETASPRLIAADLLAQAEHDPDAFPVLVTTSPELLAQVNQELTEQLATLPSAEIARLALANGGGILCDTLDEAIAAINTLAVEHLQICVANPEAIVPLVQHAGALFLGEGSAEVFGDYGVGPNHVLPTGRGARYTAGLSALTFLRARTWLRVDTPATLASRTGRIARLEGLEAHARAAEGRG